MFVRRTRGGDVEADRELTRQLVDRVRETGEAGLRVWSPPPHVSFGRRDRRAAGVEQARDAAEDLGYATATRSSGGQAVAFTAGTLAIVLATPTDDQRSGIESRYEKALADLQRALAKTGVDAERGEPPNSFCPGSHSLSVDDRKVVGLAQRVRREVAVLAGVVVVRDEDAVADLLAPVYDALDVPFDPDSVGSLSLAGGAAEPTHVGDAVVGAIRERPGDR